MKPRGLFLAFVFSAGPALLSMAAAEEYRLALPDYDGRLHWSIDEFKIIESSAKPNGREIGLRGRDSSGRPYFPRFPFPRAGERADDRRGLP
ncbi:MAG TPA: hypothetical protein VKT49_21530 [Bryobacteraceae bacterium]|nr:hypothetical protein [Bryobacteraceae bacterium]